METVCGNADEDVACADPMRAGAAIEIDYTDDEPREVVVAGLIEVGQLGRLAANERAARLAAARRYAADDGRDHPGQ